MAAVAFEGTANLTRQVEVVDQRVAASVATYGERPAVMPPWFTRNDFAWAASFLQFASVPVQYTVLAYGDSVEAAAVMAGTILDLRISDADGLPLNHRALVVGVELEGGQGASPVKLVHCLTVFDSAAPATLAVWGAAIWGVSRWGG